MSDEQTDAEPIGEDARLSNLNARLDAARQKEQVRRPTPDQAKSDANYRMGNRVLADLIGGLAGGAFIGWVIDQFAGTRPWGLLVMLFVGMGVAFRNIIRISNGRS
ncbi:ATP synthase protein I [Novosphingobium capsulatum]|uniref:ATP synthase protein I n=1 Tax=Novosphingobium capsulatum TaxID=13688 RepID=A0ABU1MFZ8_9SPHN|nr:MULTISPECIES: AtpZ/AtpI family protein [Novosphingobium]KPF53826.1 ATP synthase I [Novosphingobium sp. AAP1]MBB3478108.1 ATP synthase protein I [Novosphingobium sp. BK369]MBB3621193.1 ATP synthase protein I [Novosphingobium sp. BK592]MDR6509261.1 ATP synthase protein I [Novosphingobium capsulatum]NOX06014.1 ATP synthase protein I [Novosphingobium sp. SG754]